MPAAALTRPRPHPTPRTPARGPTRWPAVLGRNGAAHHFGPFPSPNCMPLHPTASGGAGEVEASDARLQHGVRRLCRGALRREADAAQWRCPPAHDVLCVWVSGGGGVGCRPDCSGWSGADRTPPHCTRGRVLSWGRSPGWVGDGARAGLSALNGHDWAFGADHAPTAFQGPGASAAPFKTRQDLSAFRRGHPISSPQPQKASHDGVPKQLLCAQGGGHKRRGWGYGVEVPRETPSAQI